MIKAFALLSLLLVLPLPAVLAQEEIGLNPPAMKWQQMATPAGRIIFPKGLDSLAYRAAGIMVYQQTHDRSLVGTGKTRQVPTILQNQSAMPAGFSTPAPWRNEFYTTPPQNLFTGPVPWFDYLTTHEYRHAQQFHVANQGFTLPFKILLGQTGWLLQALMNQPLWFREGDAVVAETMLTKAGRGRQPRFHMEYRALRLSGNHFSYEKAHMPASFKDFVPNPYRIGYYMTTKLRRDLGDTSWQQVLADTYRRQPVYAFNRSLKKHAGLTTKMLYQQTVKSLDSTWQQTDKHLALTPATIISRDPVKTYTNYRFPHALPDGSVIALKDALNEIRTFYKFTPGGQELPLFPYGIYSDDHLMFAGSGELMAWAEAAFDERWVNQDYSIVKTYNFRTGETKKLTAKTRYFAPAPAPDGRKIIAVHTDNYSHSALVVLDAATGKLLQELPNPGNPFLAQPRWRDDNQQVVALAVSPAGNSIIQTNIQTGQTETLLPFTTVPLSRPFPQGDYVYFSAGYSGIDNIYALHFQTKKIFQVTAVRFGAYEPAVTPQGDKLFYSNYTARGYQLAEAPINPATWPELKPGQETDIRFHEKLAGNRDLTDSTFRQDYKITPYRSFTDGLFNIYGWFPTFSNNQYGAEFYTRNLMSTLRGTLGVFYNTNEKGLGSQVNLSYAALYPIVDLEFGLRTRNKAEIRSSGHQGISEQEWIEKYALAGLRFPFRFTQGIYQSNLTLAGAYGYYEVDWVADPETQPPPLSATFKALRSSLDFSRLQQQARQQVKPRWGQTAQLHYQKALADRPERLYAAAALFLPGLAKTHSLNFSGRWKQEEVRDTYRFPDVFIMPRGYEPDPYRRIWVASGNYEFPLWYPDLALGGAAFFQRLRANLFYDYAGVTSGAVNDELPATGAELFIDLRALRLFSMTLGFRYNHAFNKNLGDTTPFQFLVTRFELAN